MKGAKILLGPSSFGTVDKAPLQKLQELGFEIVNNPYKRKLTKKELLELLSGVIGLIAGLEPLEREVLERSDLKVISRCGSGLSNVDLEAAKELGIIVRNTPLAPVAAVAELTVGCLLSLLRQIPQMNSAMHGKKWEKKIGRQLAGKRVAIVGFGNIGKNVGKLLRGFGAQVMAVDPLLSGIVEETNIVSLAAAIKESDIISLHCSGEKSLLGGKEFDLMKDGVYLLNAARGNLIDENALIAALESGKVAGAWLDTFWNEPYSGRLCDYEQVILTPHIGSYTDECRRQMEMEAVNNLIEAFKNQ